ncbi:MAG: Crp/Fnr family transcriptional regulator [Desulfobacterales bacterium]|uniref:Crp/Fnr family transcriptional regulator n=1 Tax=Candidatus Desulfaltia bathyphila TaxID=2841697 RepID=A0A8J6T867_9BACT|nr:Crp/Fnr family transcriptional regulator [Candidatus Desulfaltia bathyphila]MBL7196145.1 Crp/Fnr family transcriptional regulator [Desulfobacterales bacterium]MBL7207381.1 Crp/Fnr family transcriptional regulator [Desulfobacterales bacterium]
MQPHEIIKQIPIFKTLSDSDLNDLVGSLRLKPLKQGQALFWKGDEGTALYIVKKGTIKIVLPSRVGDEIIVTMFSKGDFFGEMALLDGEPRSADAVAIEPSEVFILSRANFLSFLQSNVNAIESILSLLSKRLRRTDDMLEDTCFLNISARLAKKLTELAESHGRKKGSEVLIDLSLTQKELGDMVGATRESINKELKSLREQGLIIIEESRIQILDISRLKSKIY